MVFGTVNRERIQLNEETLWMGGPRETDNPEARTALPDVRRLLFEGQPREAYALAERKLMGKPWRLESYQSLADLRLNFDHEGTITDYRRELDLDAAVARVTYRVDGVRYTREVFASHPDRVIVVRLTVDRPGALTFGAWIDRQQDARTEIVGNNRLNLIGQLGGGKGLSFLASAKVTAEGGTQETFPERILVDGANAATIVVAAGTSYQGQRSRRAGGNAISRRAAAKTLRRSCWTAHRADHQRLYRRVVAAPRHRRGVPHVRWRNRCRRTNGSKRSSAARPIRGSTRSTSSSAAISLIASSRPGDLPANLQGLWNDSMSPPWDADYHLNINLQMNYWPAEVTNLAELHEPLFDFLESLREPGRKTARVHYGARGFVAHHITDVWGFTSPGDLPRSGLWPTGAAWLTQHLWEHYLFNPDRAFLARAYPVMKEAAEFFLDYLVEDPRGRLVSGPSVSPENRYRLPNGQVGILTMGPSMDHQIISGLFTQVAAGERDPRRRCGVSRAGARGAEAAAAADDRQARTDPGVVGGLRRARARSSPHLAAVRAAPGRSDHRARHAGSSPRPRARRSNGAWRMAAATPAGAARGSSTSGRGSKTASGRGRTTRRCWRSRRCRICGTCIRRFRSTATSAAPRAWRRCCCRATPARFTCCRRCREAWADGEFRGLRARGGVEVDVAWSGGKIVKATLKSAKGGTFTVRLQGAAGARTMTLAPGQLHALTGLR